MKAEPKNAITWSGGMKWAASLLMFLTFLIFPEFAFADSDIGEGGGLPYEAGLENLYTSLKGPVPFMISLAGIVGCGAMLIFGGEISGFLRTMVFIVLVVAVLVQAGSIVNLLKGEGGSAGRMTQVDSEVAKVAGV